MARCFFHRTLAGKWDATKMKSNALCPWLLHPCAEAAFSSFLSSLSISFLSSLFSSVCQISSEPKTLPHAVLEIQERGASVRVGLGRWTPAHSNLSVLEQQHHPALFQRKETPQVCCTPAAVQLRAPRKLASLPKSTRETLCRH